VSLQDLRERVWRRHRRAPRHGRGLADAPAATLGHAAATAWRDTLAPRGRAMTRRCGSATRPQVAARDRFLSRSRVRSNTRGGSAAEADAQQSYRRAVGGITRV